MRSSDRSADLEAQFPTGRADWVARQGAGAFAGAAGTLLWLVLLCLGSVALQILWPSGRRLHLNITYGVMLFLSVYLNFSKGKVDHRHSPSIID